MLSTIDTLVVFGCVWFIVTLVATVGAVVTRDHMLTRMRAAKARRLERKRGA